MFDSLHGISFALQIISFLLALIFLSLLGMGVLVAPAVLMRMDALIAVLREISSKM